MQDNVCIDIKDLSFSYGDLMVLDKVNLSIKEKDFLGIIGPNGGGKTTLLKIMLGLLEPDSGIITVFGQPVEKGRRLIGYVPQRMNFDREFPVSVFDVVLMGNLTHRKWFEHYTKEDKVRAMEALEHVGLADYCNRPIGKLSQGQQQRVFIARAMSAEPKLLLMDEPTSSVDPAMQHSFYELLTELNKSMPVVLVSHDIGVIASCVTKIACLNRQLHYHDAKEIEEKDLTKVYGCCSVEMIAHGIPHRVLKEHKH